MFRGTTPAEYRELTIDRVQNLAYGNHKDSEYSLLFYGLANNAEKTASFYWAKLTIEDKSDESVWEARFRVLTVGSNFGEIPEYGAEPTVRFYKN